jgi:bacillithiol biosynthesis cysteine-adding enzyme BshC
MDAGPADVLDFTRFPAPPSALFLDYLQSRAPAAEWYGVASWGLPAVEESARRTRSQPRELGALAAALVSQQQARGANGAALQAARLADAGTVAVVTGQQAGLFGGPLYVLWKALGARLVARDLEQRGVPAVPVFWVASDDHDFAEIRTATILDAVGQLRTVRYAPEHEPVGQPAARLLFDTAIDELLNDLATWLPAGNDANATLTLLRACYRPGVSLSGAFARWLGTLLPDLVVLDPADPDLKRLMLPVMRREIEERSPSSRLALATGERLRAAGYHLQVPVRPGFLNLFVMHAGERRALAFDGDTIEIRGTGERITPAQALDWLERDPAAWSPGVLLRPLAQDLLLPTAAYVGGPAEIAYHAQIGPSYAHFGVPRPVLLPRPSVTLVEPAQARVLEAEGLTLPDLQGDPEGRLGQWARDAHPQVQAAFADARDAVRRELLRIEDLIGALDPTLRAAADSAQGRALYQIEALEEKVTRALKKRDQARAERLRRTRDALMPGGLLQERGLGLVGPIARHGSALVSLLAARVDPWARGHQALSL